MWPVFGGGQCTRYNISVLYLCLISERQNEKKNQASSLLYKIMLTGSV